MAVAYVLLRASSYRAMTSSTALSGAFRQRWDSRILLGSPPRSIMKSWTSSMVSVARVDILYESLSS